jgi:hypothetical protein
MVATGFGTDADARTVGTASQLTKRAANTPPSRAATGDQTFQHSNLCVEINSVETRVQSQ